MKGSSRFALDTAVAARPGQEYLGAFLVTIWLNSFWTGVMHVQAYLYYRRFPRDSVYIKLLVLTLCLFQTFYFCLSFLYYNLIYAAENNATILAGTWDVHYIATHRLITTTLTQVFFAGRLWAYGLHVWMMVPLGIMVVATLGIGIAENYNAWHLQPGSKLFVWSVSAWNSLMSGFRSTNSVIRMITLYGVASGTINSLLALGSLIFNQIECFSGQFLTIAWPPVITICAVLANLQVRSSLRALIPTDQSIPTPSFSMKALEAMPQRHAPGRSTHPHSINRTSPQPSSSTPSAEISAL
ncbi:hypothetical protein DL93DRAFT_1163365 [Clavulina sp. PMI_390]|nr:hypothetical protein DL93DRAFT_1163365 [Clavulina sp. PMI_390]